MIWASLCCSNWVTLLIQRVTSPNLILYWTSGSQQYGSSKCYLLCHIHTYPKCSFVCKSRAIYNHGMDEWATQLLLNSGTLCPSSYLVQGQDFILYCSTTKVNNSMLCIFARTQQITFPKPTEKGCKYILAWKVDCQTHDYFSPVELDTQNKLQNQNYTDHLYYLSLIFLL